MNADSPKTTIKPQPHQDIGIVGGGLSALATLASTVAYLRKHDIKGVNITIFEPAGNIGPGIVYDKSLPDSFILNHENKIMGTVSAAIDPDTLTKENPELYRDFWKWIQENQARLQAQHPSLSAKKFTDENAFMPRHIYGQYLVERYAQTKELAAQAGITIHEVAQKVTNIEKDGDLWKLTAGDDSAGSQAHHFQNIMLTSGHWYRKTSEQWEKTGRAFQAYPPEGYIGANAPGGTLLIRGTGLTGVDAAVAALESGKYDKVIMASRRGQLHALRGPKEHYEPKFFTENALNNAAGGADKPLTLEMIWKLAKKEFEHAYKEKGKPAPDWEAIQNPKDMTAFLREQLDDISQGNEFIWRSVIDRIDALRQHVYDRLSDADKERFRNEFQNLFISYRAATPPENGEKMLRYIEEGKLEITGGALSVGYNEETKKFEMQIAMQPDGSPVHVRDGKEGLPKGAVIKTIEADATVDATGQARAIQQSPILAELAKQGVVSPHAMGGICLSDDFRPLGKDGQPQAGLYALGAMGDGQIINLSSSLNLTEYARGIAQSLAQNIAEKRATLTPERELETIR